MHLCLCVFKGVYVYCPLPLSFTVSYFVSDYVPSQSCIHVVVFLNVDWSEYVIVYEMMPSHAMPSHLILPFVHVCAVKGKRITKILLKSSKSTHRD